MAGRKRTAYSVNQPVPRMSLDRNVHLLRVICARAFVANLVFAPLIVKDGKLDVVGDYVRFFTINYTVTQRDC